MRRFVLLAICLALGGALVHRRQSAYAGRLQLGKATFASGIDRDSGELAQYICARSQASADDPICKNWPSYGKVISAVARTMGYPEQMLSCVYLIESKYKKGRHNQGICSKRGACGLAQFMPQAAREMQQVMSKSEKFKANWAQFRSEVGGDPSPRDFTAAAVRGVGDKVDVQFFATALYFRHYYAYWENVWEAIINDDSDKLTDYYHFLVIGYNAGPKVARRFLNHFRRDQKQAYQRIPRATRRYVKDMDDCMALGKQEWTLTANLPRPGY